MSQAEKKARKNGFSKNSRFTKERRRKLSVSHSAKPQILDAVRDQHGGRWIRYGTKRKDIWFAVADLVSHPSGVFRQLCLVDDQRLTHSSQTRFKQEVEKHRSTREALVATQPGWLENFYVHGDGTIDAPRSDRREVIVVFETNPKFEPKGSLEEWQSNVGPLLTQQAIPMFALGIALTGPIMRLAPRGYLNPLAEIVGRSESGKTSVGAMAASVWAGNLESDCGGGELWDATPNALDPIKMAHRDGFVFLDEGNLAGMTSKDQQDFMRRAVFKLAATGVKRRMGDPIKSEQARISLLSTTNTALTDVLDGPADAQGAAISRMITLRIDATAPFGPFDFLPAGYRSARQASEAMRGAADFCWGGVGRAFVKRLVRQIDRDEEGLMKLIAGGLDKYIGRDRAPPGSARIQKTFAVVAVAIALAQRWCIIPRSWGSPLRLIQALAGKKPRAEMSNEEKARRRIRDYVERHRGALVDVAGLKKPLTAADFSRADGFLRRGSAGQELLVPAARLRKAFPDFRHLVGVLRKSGDARTEGGLNPKLTIKTPKAVCGDGRVYCFQI